LADSVASLGSSDLHLTRRLATASFHGAQAALKLRAAFFFLLAAEPSEKCSMAAATVLPSLNRAFQALWRT
jgi:hypothetical protein